MVRIICGSVHGPWRSAPETDNLSDLGIVGTREQVIATIRLQKAVRALQQRQRRKAEQLVVRDLDTGARFSLTEANTAVQDAIIPPRRWWLGRRTIKGKRVDALTNEEMEDLAILMEAEKAVDEEAKKAFERERAEELETQRRAIERLEAERQAMYFERREYGMEKRIAAITERLLIQQKEEREANEHAKTVATAMYKAAKEASEGAASEAAAKNAATTAALRIVAEATSHISSSSEKQAAYAKILEAVKALEASDDSFCEPLF